MTVRDPRDRKIIRDKQSNLFRVPRAEISNMFISGNPEMFNLSWNLGEPLLPST